MTETEYFDAVVIGGGPAGATVATFLAREGLNVAVCERKIFPRFHVGESLLPASVPILEELGVHDRVREHSIRKPGGKWYYGNRAVFSEFSETPPGSSFHKTPYAYMVKRDEFDDILLDNARNAGASVFRDHAVTDLVTEGSTVTGVVATNEARTKRAFHAPIVFDCSGYAAVVANKLNIRSANGLKRMAVFGHYKAAAVIDDLKNGWFLGQMVYNGWLWLIPLKADLVSIGIVIPKEEYTNARKSPREFLEGYIRTVPLSKDGIARDFELEGQVHVYGNLGYTTSKAFGDGWVLVGDSAFFIDPCYSSGVHLALVTAKQSARIYLEQLRSGGSIAQGFEKYEKAIRHEEKLVLRLVESFYMASRNRFLKWLVPATLTERMNRKMIPVTGGDFTAEPSLVNTVYHLSRLISFAVPLKAG